MATTLMLLILCFRLVSAFYQPAEKCRLESPWFAGHEECWIANSTWNYDHVLSRAKATVAAALPNIPVVLPSSNISTPLFVYLHVFVQPNNPGGLLIANSILSHMEQSGILDIASTVYVVAYGDIKHVNMLRIYKNVRIVTQLAKLHYMFEFPTLALLQHHAQELRSNAPNARLLYLHTKGVTRLFDPVRIYIRRIMVEFHIVHYSQALRFLEAGYKAVGILYTPLAKGHHYMGNFFWVTPELVVRNARVLDLVWHWRFGAEKWVLSSASPCEVYTQGVRYEDAEVGFYRGEVKSIRGMVSDVDILIPSC